jgi:hypothetical protein
MLNCTVIGDCVILNEVGKGALPKYVLPTVTDEK